VLAVAVGLLAVGFPGAALAAVLGLLFLAVCFADLSVALCGFTVLIFFERFAGSTGAAKAAGLVLAAAWAIRLLARRDETPFLLRSRPLLGAAAVLVLFLAFASALWADDPGRTVDSAVRLAQVVVLFLIAYSAAATTRRAELLALAFVLGSFLAAGTGLVTGEGFAETDRLSGGILDPNFLAASLVAAVGIAVVLLLDARREPLLRLGLAVALATDLLALLRTESRGGLVALGVVLLALLVYAGPLRPRALVVALLVVVAGVGYYTVAASLETRERIANFTAEGGAGRSDQYRIALEMTADNPVLGVGLANFPVEEPAYTAQDIRLERVRQILEIEPVVHNSYLEPLAELGPLGLAGFLVAVAGPAVLARRWIRRHPTDTLVVGLLLGLLGLLVAYFFLSGQYEKQLWLLAGLTVGAVDAAARAGGRPFAGAPPAGPARPGRA
jgi:O-antigen ligase